MKILNRIPNKAKKLVSGALAVVIAAAAMGPLATVSSATLSLDYIEEIKLKRRESGMAMPYRILEIAPDTLQSTMGYYASGQEQIDDYLKNYLNSGTTTSSTRTNYMNNTLYKGLKDKGIMAASQSNAYPMYLTDGYKEYMPWEVKPADAKVLQLNSQEGFSATGTFVPVDEEHQGQGEYTLEAAYTLSEQYFNFKSWAGEFYTDGENDDGHPVYKLDNSNFIGTKRGLGGIGVGNNPLSVFNHDYMEFGQEVKINKNGSPESDYDGSVTVVSDSWGLGSVTGVHTAYPLYHGSNTITGGKDYIVSFDLELTPGQKAFFFIIGYNGSAQSSDTRTEGTDISDIPDVISESGHYCFRYSPPNTTLKKTTNYQICFGVKSKNTTATFSNIRVTEGVAAENSRADYIQDINRFELAPDNSPTFDETGEYYYYNLNFTQIPGGEGLPNRIDSLPEGTCVYYQKNNNGVWTDIDFFVKIGDTYDGIMDTLEVNEYLAKYYLAEIDETAFPFVTKQKDAQHPYRAVPVHLSEYSTELKFGAVQNPGNENNGYFRAEAAKYNYVGTGGNFNFIYDSSGTVPYTIYTDKVWYTKGVVNNDWFKEKVLDCEKNDDGSFKQDVFEVTVTTVTTAELMSGQKNYWINQMLGYDLIVVSSGFNPLGSAASYSTDIDETVRNGILNANNPESNLIPVVIDINVANCGKTKLAALANSFISKTSDNGKAITSGGVSKNVYAFNKSHTTNASNIITKELAAEFNSAVTASDPNSPYYDVWYEIDEENFIRGVKNQPLLSTVISEAACMRSIINYAGRRVYNKKDKIRVLEIEPYTNKKSLTKEKVLSWFPSDGFTTTPTVTIECMSPTELCGMNNTSVIEKYDLVYVGASLDNLTDARKMTVGDKSVPNYNDDSMDGLFYTSIGDLFTLGNAGTIIEGDTIAGLNGVDYTGRSGGLNYMMSGTMVRARDAGNDITEVIEKQLEEFADSGMPVIFADDLVQRGYQNTFHVDMVMKVGFRDQYQSTNAASEYYRYMVYYEAVLKSDDPDRYLPEGVEPTFAWYYKSGSKYICINDQKNSDHSNGLEEPIHDDINENGEYRTRIGTLNSSGQITDGMTVKKEKNDFEYQSFPGQYFVRLTLKYKQDYDGPKYSAFNNVDYISNTLTTAVQTINFHSTYNNSTKKATFWITRLKPKASESAVSQRENVKIEDLNANYGSNCGLWFDSNKWYGRKQIVFWFNDQELGGASMNWNSSTKQYEGTCGYNNDNKYLKTIIKFHLSTGFGFDSNPKLAEINTGWDYGQHDSSPGATFDMPTITVNNEGTRENIPLSTGNMIDTSRVDNTSYLYKFMSYAYDSYKTIEGEQVNAHPNAMAEYQLTGAKNADNRKLMLRYLNLSTPKLQNVTYTEYPAVLSGSELSISFSITNPTDTSPLSTRYRCYLFIDENHDSKFEAKDEDGNYLEEKSFSITENGVLISPNQLKTSITGNSSRTYNYTLKHNLGKNFMGIVPWKIVIVKTTDSTSHDSFVGYSYVKTTEPKIVKSLQILPADWTCNLEGNWTNQGVSPADGNAYKGSVFLGDNSDNDAFYQLTKASMINKTGVKLAREVYTASDDPNQYWASKGETKQRKHIVFYVNYDKANPNATPDLEDLDSYLDCDFILDVGLSDILEMNTIFDTDKGNVDSDFLNAYNMLILGFGDSYGRASTTSAAFELGTWISVGTVTLGFNYGAARAISIYAEDTVNHTLLFCHDTTNTSNNYIRYVANDALSTVVSAGQNITDAVLGWFGAGRDESKFHMDIQQSRVKQGYYNNIIMRQALNLDRYGITYSINKQITKQQWMQDKMGVGYGKDGTLWDDETVTYRDVYNHVIETYTTNHYGNESLTRGELLAKNFSIVYKPKSARMLTNPDTGDYYLAPVKNITNDAKSLDPSQNYAVIGSARTKNYDQNDVGLIRANYEPYAHGFTNLTIARYMVNRYSPLYTGENAGFFQRVWNGVKSLAYYLWDSITGNTSGNSYIQQERPIGAPDYYYYGQDSNNPVTLTNKITQVNKGQITTYPYNVNTAEYGGTTGAKEKNIVSNEDEYKITIYPTHEQVYQANINGDEVSVWYCLAGSSDYNTTTNRARDYDILPNDVANNYYIFSVRNVIYTGAGHANIFTLEEAELFLNTLVAGYRPGNEQPIAEFKELNGIDTTNYKVIAADDVINDDGEVTGQLIEDEVVAIKVSDPNHNKALTLTFYQDTLCNQSLDSVTTLYSTYKTVNGERKGDGTAIEKKTDGTFAVEADKVYYIEIPRETLNKVGTDNEAVIYAKATTGTGNASVSSNVEPLYIRKANQYNLT